MADPQTKSLGNSSLCGICLPLYALIWPVFIVQWAMPLGAIALGVAFWLFPIYVKPHIEGWLFDGEPETEEEPEKAKEPESAAGP